VADATPFFLRIGNASELVQKTRARVHHAEVDAEVAPEGLFYLVSLMQSQKPMVYEDAGEAIANGAVDKSGGDRGVYPSRQATDDPTGRAYHVLNPRDFGFYEVTRGPVRCTATDLEQEIVEDLSAPRSMRHLRMELHPVERPALMLESSNGRIGAGGSHPISRRGHIHVVPVAHPDRSLLPGPEASEQPSPFDSNLGSPVLTPARASDIAAREVSEKLHPVTEPEHGCV
jgi:hypothetical protein